MTHGHYFWRHPWSSLN